MYCLSIGCCMMSATCTIYILQTITILYILFSIFCEHIRTYQLYAISINKVAIKVLELKDWWDWWNCLIIKKSFHLIIEIHFYKCPGDGFWWSIFSSSAALVLGSTDFIEVYWMLCCPICFSSDEISVVEIISQNTIKSI